MMMRKGVPEFSRKVVSGRMVASAIRKRWIDTVKDCLRKRCLDVRKGRRMVQGLCEGECMG